jgi:hypothetical protein
MSAEVCFATSADFVVRKQTFGGSYQVPGKIISMAAGRIWSFGWTGHYPESSASQKVKARQARRK